MKWVLKANWHLRNTYHFTAALQSARLPQLLAATVTYATATMGSVSLLHW
jgi:hypothetical protein